MFSFSDLLNFYSLFYYRQRQETYSCLFTHNRTRSRTHTQTHALSYHKLCCSIVPRYWTIQHNHTHAHSHTQCRSCFFFTSFSFKTFDWARYYLRFQNSISDYSSHPLCCIIEYILLLQTPIFQLMHSLSIQRNHLTSYLFLQHFTCHYHYPLQSPGQYSTCVSF